MTEKRLAPNRILFYFRAEAGVLAVVAATGILYNAGLLAAPWFEGQMTAALVRILRGEERYSAMLTLVCGYIAAVCAVQGFRFLKRFYVRRFANNVNRRMKGILYGALVRSEREELEKQGAGEMLTKAISDVDDCAEGMRKFTTEVFDTGVAMVCYAALLLFYDWRLALLSMAFLPLSYFLADELKKPVQRTGAAFKKQAAALGDATMDRAVNALTYRVFGREEDRRRAYEENLAAYERAAVRANLWAASAPPLYRVLSMAGTVLILYFGGKNVLGDGWESWSIAEFTTFLACFTKLATRSSKAAKLFNAVHRAQVSWQRIRPLLRVFPAEKKAAEGKTETLEVSSLSCGFAGEERLFSALSFAAGRGQIIGVAGPVACGKSTFGRAFLCEREYGGSIRLDGRELRDIPPRERAGLVGYLGHDTELFSASVRENILLGEDGDAGRFLRAVCLDGEVSAMPGGEDTLVGTGGIRLSGGQAQRLALARTLAHPRPVIILDDPFSALDRKTEAEIFANLRALAANSIVILISHRLYLFDQLDLVIWLENGRARAGTHRQLLENEPAYAAQFFAGGEEDHENG